MTVLTGSQQQREDAVLGQRRFAFDVGHEAVGEQFELAIDRPGELAAAVLRRRLVRGEEDQDTGDQDRPHPAIMITPSSAGQS